MANPKKVKRVAVGDVAKATAKEFLLLEVRGGATELGSVFTLRGAAPTEAKARALVDKMSVESAASRIAVVETRGVFAIRAVTATDRVADAVVGRK